MEGPPTVVNLDKDGNVIYGYQRGLNLLEIKKVFPFRNKTWFLVLWEGYDMLEAVPAEKIIDKFSLMIIEYFETLNIIPKLLVQSIS